MAKNQPLRPRSDSEQLRRHVVCSREGCDRLSREVRLLPCLHLCCERCLNAVANERAGRGEEEGVGGIEIREKNFCCPKEGCKKRISYDYLQQNERAQLNRWLSELVQNLQARDKLLRGEMPFCTDCQLRPAVAMCRHRDCCDTRLCELCQQHHRESVKTRDHADDVVPIQRLVEQLNEEDPPRGLRTKPLRCRTHPHRKLRFYCKRTRELVCTSGMLTYHRPNCSLDECKAVEDFLDDPDHMPKMLELKEALNGKLAELQVAVNEVNAIKDDLLARKENVEEMILARIRELVEELDRQEAVLRERVETIYNIKVRKLDAHSDKLAQIRQEMEQSAQFVTDFLDNYRPSPVEFFLLKDHIQPAVEEILNTYKSHCFNSKEDATLNYDPNNGFHQERAMGSISSSPDPENFITERPAADIQLRALQVSAIRVTCRDAGNAPTSDNMPPLRAKLVPDEDDLGGQDGSENHPDAVDCVVIRHRSTGRYSVSVFPPSDGPHCLWVYQDCPKPTGKRHIQGSPFQLVVQERRPSPFPPWLFI